MCACSTTKEFETGITTTRPASTAQVLQRIGSMKTQFELLEEDLSNAISNLPREELDKRLPLVELFLGEYAYFEDIETVNLNPVTELTRQFAEYGSYDIALVSLLLAETLTKRIELAGEQDDLTLVNRAIGAINCSNQYFKKNAKEKSAIESAFRQKDKQTARRLNEIRYEKLNELKDAICSEYEPVILEIRNENIRPTYDAISQRIAPRIEHLNGDRFGRRLIGRNGDLVGAIASILRKAVAAKTLKSPLEYR